MNNRLFVLAQSMSQLKEGRGAARRHAVEDVLAAAGELLRRRGLEEADRSTVHAALKALAPSDVAAFAEGVDLAGLEARLIRAAEEALEAALPEDEADGDTWGEWATQGLAARDRLASQLEALGVRAALVPPAAAGTEALGALRAQVDALDVRTRPLARRFTALNAWRRQQAQALTADPAARAWWFSHRASCDGFLQWLGGARPVPHAHLEACADCRHDLARSALIEEKRARHLSEEDLWELDLDTASEEARAYAQAHAEVCSECAQALAALEEGEAAIVELTGDARSPVSTGATVLTLPLRPPAAPPEAPPEVLAEHEGFRVLAFRRRDRVRLLLQPHEGRRIAAAAVFLPAQPQRAVPGRRSAEGFEFDLRVLSGPARVRVRLLGAPEVEQELAL